MEVVIDSVTPINAKLTALYKKSFAYATITDRLPVIVTGLIDFLVRDKNTIAGFSNECYNSSECKEEIKAIIGDLSELKYQIQTAKPLTPFSDLEDDGQNWNKDLKEKQSEIGEVTCYSGTWIFVECYIYRRIREIFITKKFLKDWDPFLEKKELVLKSSLPVITQISDRLLNNNILGSHPLKTTHLLEELSFLMKGSLWANRVDLSMSSGDPSLSNNCNLLAEDWDSYLLVDDSEKVINHLFTPSSPICENKIIDYVLDNAGLELLCDLCFADFLVSRCKISKVRFRVKRIPWFISDVTEKDFKHTIQSALLECSSIKDLAKRWQDYLDQGVWTLHADQFWCLGRIYDEMATKDKKLYKELQNSFLVIFKGDLNYRKLVGDTNWPPDLPFKEALGSFQPCPLLAIRTCKADTIAGLPTGIAEKTEAQSPDWLVSGMYGLIQFHSPIPC